MNQEVVLIRINGELIDHVFHSVPDYDEAVRICRYYGYKEYNCVFDSHFLEYEFLNMVSKESGKSIADDALLFLYDSGDFTDFEERLYEFCGLSVETSYSKTIEVMSEDLED